MRYFDEFYDRKLCENLANKIVVATHGLPLQITFMEVCGTHTMAVARNGLKSMLPQNIKLLSGPGCPVCVTPNSEIDKAIAIARLNEICLATFGDMMKVPGSYSSLEKERAQGRDIRVVYSTIDAVKIAEENPSKTIVFLGVGFETTAPTVAVSIKYAKTNRIKNYKVMGAHKLIPPAIKAILDSGELRVDGFLLPGHVSTIIGRKIYEFIPQEYKVACAIAGFEPVDILQSVLQLINQVKDKKPQVENCYTRSVREEGNLVAKELMSEVFDVCDSEWRGVGVIPNSGLKISEKYKEFDVDENIEIKVEEPKSNPNCLCGAILRGVNTPLDCRLFGKVCTPETPVGPCMVSSEGTCAAYYKYGNFISSR